MALLEESVASGLGLGLAGKGILLGQAAKREETGHQADWFSWETGHWFQSMFAHEEARSIGSMDDRAPHRPRF